MELLPLLLMAIAVRYLWARYLPVVSPRGWFYSTLGAYFGALGGSILQRLFLPLGPQLLGIYILGAIAGSIVVLFVWGAWPQLRTLLGGR
jgi:uncharacterized membrane protein YeaQ/YmgE (transglycosylase-associated protein family)